MSKQSIKQFEIWMVDLNPIKGSEQAGVRPCLVIQSNASNNKSSTTLIAPFSSRKRVRPYPNEVVVSKSKLNGLKDVSCLKLNQIRVVDKVRFIKKIGKLEEDYLIPFFGVLFDIFDVSQSFYSE